VAVGLHHPCLFFLFPPRSWFSVFCVVGSVVQNPGTRNLARERCGVGGANANQVDAKISAQVFTSTATTTKRRFSRHTPIYTTYYLAKNLRNKPVQQLCPDTRTQYRQGNTHMLICITQDKAKATT
jgi:hypothetical protein